MEGSYPLQARNTVRRHRERAKYDFETVHSIVNASPILHVSFLPTNPADDPFPTTLPMIGYLGSFDGPSTGALDLYLHGHSASRVMRLAGNLGHEGIPVCVAATLIVMHGYASVVTAEAEKDLALRLITDGLVPGCWDNSRVPPTRAENVSTSVLRVHVASANGKISQGGPSDDRKDLQDDEVTGRVWTGTLPVWEFVGTPIPSITNKVAQVPDYVVQWRQNHNAENESYAREAIGNIKQ
ncbi:flavin-nucleotide-binding protein [Penicillium waksmanii]|uniref:flavin-nucleotide-binding protein n=1 Tax=Penicillium waksmanii TaxID=69791 RepID=UPI002548403B|nr:flavin-nucleotide-binding protein [Penicillium waksmanii]KAJ6000859.1 flavin-nucleotide-binding protein [Penicillium waksmanii]